MTDRGWRPQDCDLIDAMSDAIERWVVAGSSLLNPRVQVYMRGQVCSACGSRTAHRHNGTESVRSPALRVAEDGCRCLNCRASWAPKKFGFFA